MTHTPKTGVQHVVNKEKPGKSLAFEQMNIEIKPFSLEAAAPSLPVQQVAKEMAAPVTAEKPVEAAARQPAPQVPPTAAPEPSPEDASKRIAMVEKMMGANKALVIEKDEASLGYIYKTIDKETGEVTRVWPMERKVSQLLNGPDASVRAAMQGTVIDQRA